MEWLQVETTLPDHRKIARLASELKLSRVHAVGLVVCFWLWAVHNREDGILEDIDTDTIARVTDFKGKPEKLVSALCSCGLLDRLDSGYVIHDWEERVGLLIDKRNQQREQTRDRVQKYRARKKQESETACNDDVTRYGNDGVTRYGNKRVTRNGNASNGDVTPLTLHNTTLHNTTSSIEEDEEDEDVSVRVSRARARAEARLDRIRTTGVDEGAEDIDPNSEQFISRLIAQSKLLDDNAAAKRIDISIQRSFNRKATPMEIHELLEIFDIRKISREAIPAAISIAALNGANAIIPYVKKIADEWRGYPIQNVDQAIFLQNMLDAECGRDRAIKPELAKKTLEEIRNGTYRW